MWCAVFVVGGGGEIRTHDTVSRMTVFKTVALNHSATPPKYKRGSGRIRTSDRVAPMPVFETGAFNHSATLPKYYRNPQNHTNF